MPTFFDLMSEIASLCTNENIALWTTHKLCKRDGEREIITILEHEDELQSNIKIGIKNGIETCVNNCIVWIVSEDKLPSSLDETINRICAVLEKFPRSALGSDRHMRALLMLVDTRQEEAISKLVAHQFGRVDEREFFVHKTIERLEKVTKHAPLLTWMEVGGPQQQPQ